MASSAPPAAARAGCGFEVLLFLLRDRPDDVLSLGERGALPPLPPLDGLISEQPQPLAAAFAAVASADAALHRRRALAILAGVCRELRTAVGAAEPAALIAPQASHISLAAARRRAASAILHALRSIDDAGHTLRETPAAAAIATALAAVLRAVGGGGDAWPPARAPVDGLEAFAAHAALSVLNQLAAANEVRGVNAVAAFAAAHAAVDAAGAPYPYLCAHVDGEHGLDSFDFHGRRNYRATVAVRAAAPGVADIAALGEELLARCWALARVRAFTALPALPVRAHTLASLFPRMFPPGMDPLSLGVDPTAFYNSHPVQMMVGAVNELNRLNATGFRAELAALPRHHAMADVLAGLQAELAKRHAAGGR